MAGQSDVVLPPRQLLTRQSAFSTTDVHPLVFDQLLGDRYGVDWLLWEPETLWSSIETDYHLKAEISKQARAGIQAIRTVHDTDDFYQEWQVTNWCIQALWGNLPDFDVLQDASPAQIVHGVHCAYVMRGEMVYGAEVQQWMACEFLDDGMLYAPEPVQFIQDEIAMIEARCKKCGNVEWADGLTECPSCGAPRDQLELQPKNLWTDVRDFWKLHRGLNTETVVLQEDRLGVQMARLFVVRDLVREKFQLCNQQLKDLGYDAVPIPNI